MRILLWHGHLLSGSGSNVYTANVARVWREQGHDVLLLCQDRRAGALPYVDGYGELPAEEPALTVRPTGTVPAPGRLRVVRPDIGDVLPVYVYDPYEGFTAKRFVDLNDAELAYYVHANVEALTTAVRAFAPDTVVVGHEVMGPYVARLVRERTGMPYTVKLHGSALEYAVKLQQRYLEYAREGFAAADTVVGTSRYMCEEAAAVVPGDWTGRTAVVNPGCDVRLFRPGVRDPAAPRVGFVGKLIAAKGPQNLLAALGRTTTPGLTAELVGYGDLATDLRAMHDALRRADVAGARRVLPATTPTDRCRAFLDTLDAPGAVAAYRARLAEVPVSWPGRLDHDRLPAALARMDVLVVPSEVPEAFGMVAAEAAAAGVLPVVPRHSGIGEIGAAAEDALETPGLLTYGPADPVRGIAARVDAVLAHDARARIDMGATLAALARDRWSWEQVAGRLLAAARSRSLA